MNYVQKYQAFCGRCELAYSREECIPRGIYNSLFCPKCNSKVRLRARNAGNREFRNKRKEHIKRY